MPLYANVIIFLTAVCLVVLLDKYIIQGKKRVEGRLSAIREMADRPDENELRMPFYERVIRPAYDKLGNALGNLAPQEIRKNIEEKIVYAGNPWNLSFNNFVGVQVVLAAAFLIISLAAVSVLELDGKRSVLVVLLFMAIGVFFPYLVLQDKVKKRQSEIQKKLPDALDLLLVSVEAGLGFDMAIKKVAETMPGVLSRELARAQEEIRLGKTREEALRGIVKRTGVADLNTFVGAVIQADQLGGSIVKTLRAQADSMRQKRKQRAEESAMKAPIKMLFPLVFFIFPTLFIVLLGPSAIRILSMFKELF